VTVLAAKMVVTEAMAVTAAMEVTAAMVETLERMEIPAIHKVALMTDQIQFRNPRTRIREVKKQIAC
jgi:hypothetical protein